MDFSLEDLLSIDTENNVKASSKFKPKPKPKPKPKTQPEPKPTPTPPPQPVETVTTTTTPNNEIINNTEEQQPFDVNQISFEKPHEENGESYLTLENLESLNDFLPQSTTVTDTPTIQVSIVENIETGPTEPDLENLSQIDPLTGVEASIFNDNEDFNIENLSSVSKDAESSLFFEPLDILTESRTSAGPKVGKFKPKPKAQTRKMENIHSDSSQIDYMDNTSIPMFTSDELFGSSSIGITDSIPTDSIPDFHVPEEPHFTEMSQVGHESVKNGNSQSSEQSQESQGGRSSKRLRKQSNKTLSLIDEYDNDDVIHTNEDNNNNNNNIDEYTPENESVSEKKGKKSKKKVNDKEKSVRKRKKASEVPDESTKVKKKFPHSTRRNKRTFDQKLLSTPEEDLDLTAFKMKDLIRFAEYKERIAKKEASTSGTPALNQSDRSFSNNFDYENEGFGEEREDDDYIMEAENATYYNYRTHMKITPRMKWTKQDTQLFYEAVQQFGTDLSMIKECFPGRTREQIKSKYKKEEKQNPLRLNDALTTRFKGNSHFEEVIQRLKQANGQDSEDEDPINLEGEENEDDVANVINENTKHVESEKKDEEMEGGDAPAIGSPTKSHDSDDDMFRWSQYKSDI